MEVEGHIKDVSEWNVWDLKMVLVDFDSGKTIDVTVDSEAANNIEHLEKFIPGAKIRVNGLVEDYQGDLLIHVTSSEGVKLLVTAQSNTIPLSVILERPEVFEGVLVVVSGQVWDIDEIESINAVTFCLQNSSEDGYYSVNCIVFDASRLMDRDSKRIQSGDEVIFTGTFEYYASNGIWQIQSYEGKESLEKVD